MTKQLYIQPERCIGCKTCELVCSKEHFGVFDPQRAAISVVRDFENPSAMPLMCFQCGSPRCVDVCRTRALTLTEDRVIFEPSRCIGCRLCVMTCPFGNLRFSPEVKRLIKCDLCGEEPKCVERCRQQAIQFVEVEDLMKEKRSEMMKMLFEAEKAVTAAQQGGAQ